MELKLQSEIIYGSTEEAVENRIHGFLDLPGVNDQNIEYYRENDNSFAAVIYYYGVPEYN